MQEDGGGSLGMYPAILIQPLSKLSSTLGDYQARAIAQQTGDDY
jgi:hypothetical protein